MTTPEIGFLLLTLILLLRVLVVPGFVARQISPRTIAIAALLTLAAHIAIGGLRWQLAPAYLAIIVLLPVSFRNTRPRTICRAAGVVVCGLLLLAATVLAQGLPILKLPVPDGPFAVGSFFSSLTDESRVEAFDPRLKVKRELTVEVWYPAQKANEDHYSVEPLWSELYAGQFDWVSFFFGYLKHVQSHSHVGLPIAVSAGPFPVLLYDSGVGWTSQNTLLMEHLASHGYVVISVSHPYEQLKVNLPKAGTALLKFSGDATERSVLIANPARVFQRVWFDATSIPNESRRMRLLTGYMTLCGDVATLPTIVRQEALVAKVLRRPDIDPKAKREGVDALYHFCRVMNEVKNREIERQLADTTFIADHLLDLQAPVSAFTRSLNFQRMGVFGHSDGGAIAGEFCKVDIRCRAGLNIDGTQFGPHWSAPVRAPFATIYSAAQQGLNGFAYPHRRDDFTEYVVAKAGHLDFLDLGMVMPLLKTLLRRPLGFGKISAIEADEITEWIALAFFDRYLKGANVSLSPPPRFPELRRRMPHDFAALADRDPPAARERRGSAVSSGLPPQGLTSGSSMTGISNP